MTDSLRKNEKSQDKTKEEKDEKEKKNDSDDSEKKKENKESPVIIKAPTKKKSEIESEDEKSEDDTQRKKKKKNLSIRPAASVRSHATLSTQRKVKKDKDGADLEERKTEREKKKKDKKKKKRSKKPTTSTREQHHEDKSIIEQARQKYNLITPKNEVEIEVLELEAPLSTQCKYMEAYKLVLEQTYTLLISLMRRGNGTTGFDNIKSEKGNTAPDKLCKSLMLSSVFWSTATEFQPALLDSVKSNTAQIAAAERHLQEKGPKHMKKIRKFIEQYYPTYVELKMSLLKLNKTRPDSVHEKEDLLKKISSFVKERYKDGKHTHAAEIQCALTEIMLYHRATEKNWYNIAERKMCTANFCPEDDRNPFALAIGASAQPTQFKVLPVVDSTIAIKFQNIIARPAPVVPSNLASYAYALDFSVPATLSALQCVKKAGYQAIFVRAYNPSGQGSFDTNSCNTIQNAYSAGLGIEVYLTPQPSSTKQGYQQLDEVYQGLTAKGITIRSIWIQVTSPANWKNGATANVNFINSIIARARQYGLTVGVYTSYYDWNQITNGWTNVGSDVLLWYWNVLGGGVAGESPANFQDFRAFGCWTAPTVKQFAQVETVCGLTVNRDVYATSSMSMSDAIAESNDVASQGIFVGQIGLAH
ncbi:unnamed protein product [Caenorhabditis angaria]|uniref:Uncharacterized protein n=1 Tax=Caenorhabditis angaria TaxID=860376 RepID=A0A9P1IDM3_9PELO|nr:unnamed protein product [Caenorhabditis angaria]